ncbi:hypothetical protein [Sphingomonas dokdonensis]|uniref:Uncharacterized protein n=1 Tax=Sphingomonas dokdonensis TaxID=344880 RepID=A0A245ZNK8_9SPHN|nr:hypothetical protein [Sphingomonas dokdonensis]OWK31341.1 hypothetical protein SPDO_13490 [Sphingomonas dokdonensis]
MKEFFDARVAALIDQPRQALHHRERAVAERRAAGRAIDPRAQAAHLELAHQHDLAQALAWHDAERPRRVAIRPGSRAQTLDLSVALPLRVAYPCLTKRGNA